MTSYLWYSAEQEEVIRENSQRRSELQDSFRRSAHPSTGFCIYFDSFGEPVKITEVSQDATPPANYRDLRLVDTVESDSCLVCTSGVIDDHAKEFCAEKNIPPTLWGLLKYISDRDQTANYLRRDVKVGRAFRLKTKASQG